VRPPAPPPLAPAAPALAPVDHQPAAAAEPLRTPDQILAGKRVLVVDDDIRNVYAMTALLESEHMAVLSAENGREALRALDAHPDVDVVLMDVMMPELDGHAATRLIREDPRFAALPVLALTAKAMRGDRDQCIAAGASDYISKPVDGEQLLSLLRVWLSR
jgi:CheY-like chemotaxis protein